MGFTSEYSLDKMNEKYCGKKFLILFVSGWVRCGLGWIVIKKHQLNYRSYNIIFHVESSFRTQLRKVI